MIKGIYISDSIHGLTRLSGFEKKIIESVGFNRLHDVYQNSTVYLTYPSNRTKRFEHSIGTMRLCSDMFYNSISNSPKETLEKFYTLYEGALEDVRKSLSYNREFESLLKKSPKKLPKLEWDNFQRSLIPSIVEEKYETVHMILIQAIRAAALLHDIGHPPYSHVVERAMKSAYKQQKLTDNKNENEYFNIMEKYFDGKKPLHEVMGDEVSRSVLKGILMETDSANERIFEALILQSVLKIFNEDDVFSYLHRIIDGSLDGDRLDYVTRDLANSGMNVGSIDYSRIILDMRIIFVDNIPRFCIPLKATNAVDDFFKRRFDLYKNIIHHHRVIKTDYLMEYTVTKLIEKYLTETPANSQNDVTETETIPFDISGLWAPLGSGTLEERNCVLSQWNDSWLITVLKKIYYEQYYEKENLPIDNDIISKQFEELLMNQRHYLSLIKRTEDFKSIDDSLRNVLLAHKEELYEKVNELNERSEKYIIKITEDENKKMVDVAEFLDQITNLTTENTKNENSFIMAKLFDRKNILLLENFENNVKKIADDVCKEKLQKNYLNGIVVFKQISLGITPDDPIFFFDNNENTYTLDQVSGIVKTLRTENLFRPVFYLYVLVDGKKDSFFEKKPELLSAIGERIGNYVLETITNNLNILINKL